MAMKEMSDIGRDRGEAGTVVGTEIVPYRDVCLRPWLRLYTDCRECVRALPPTFIRDIHLVILHKSTQPPCKQPTTRVYRAEQLLPGSGPRMSHLTVLSALGKNTHLSFDIPISNDRLLVLVLAKIDNSATCTCSSC